MNVAEITSLIGAFIGRHGAALYEISKRESQLLELGAIVAVQEHYRSNGFAVTVKSPGASNEFVVKRNTRGHPAKYSKVIVDRGSDAAELHMNLLVRSAHDEGIYCVDVAIIRPGFVPEAVKREPPWLCVENEPLLSFAEVKRLVVYPMLLAQFIGIVHELKPQFLGPSVPTGFSRTAHLPPTLIVLGPFSGNSKTIVDTYPQRGFTLTIAERFDDRVAAHRKGSSKSPLYWDDSSVAVEGSSEGAL